MSQSVKGFFTRTGSSLRSTFSRQQGPESPAPSLARTSAGSGSSRFASSRFGSSRFAPSPRDPQQSPVADSPRVRRASFLGLPIFRGSREPSPEPPTPTGVDQGSGARAPSLAETRTSAGSSRFAPSFKSPQQSPVAASPLVRRASFLGLPIFSGPRQPSAEPPPLPPNPPDAAASSPARPGWHHRWPRFGAQQSFRISPAEETQAWDSAAPRSPREGPSRERARYSPAGSTPGSPSQSSAEASEKASEAIGSSDSALQPPQNEGHLAAQPKVGARGARRLSFAPLWLGLSDDDGPYQDYLGPVSGAPTLPTCIPGRANSSGSASPTPEEGLDEGSTGPEMAQLDDAIKARPEGLDPEGLGGSHPEPELYLSRPIGDAVALGADADGAPSPDLRARLPLVRPVAGAAAIAPAADLQPQPKAITQQQLSGEHALSPASAPELDQALGQLSRRPALAGGVGPAGSTASDGSSPVADERPSPLPADRTGPHEKLSTARATASIAAELDSEREPQMEPRGEGREALVETPPKAHLEALPEGVSRMGSTARRISPVLSQSFWEGSGRLPPAPVGGDGLFRHGSLPTPEPGPVSGAGPSVQPRKASKPAEKGRPELPPDSKFAAYAKAMKRHK